MFENIINIYRSQKCIISDFIGIVGRMKRSSSWQPLVVVRDTNTDNPNFSILLNLFLNYDCHNCHTLVTRPLCKTSIEQVILLIEFQ